MTHHTSLYTHIYYSHLNHNLIAPLAYAYNSLEREKKNQNVKKKERERERGIAAELQVFSRNGGRWFFNFTCEIIFLSY